MVRLITASIIQHQVRGLRLSLLSDDESIVEEARALLAALNHAGPTFRALANYDDLRDWIHHRKKPMKVLTDALAQARADVLANPNDFTTNWVLALCLKYSRLYEESEQYYQRAYDHAETTSEQNDLQTDWAELHIYMANASSAKSMIEAADPNSGWHPWVYAFALHQYAHESDPDSGDITWYEASNAELMKWPDFGKNPDAHLLIAANWGGIARRRKDPNGPEAKKALDAMTEFFKTTAVWSIKREKRGPFISGLPLSTDPGGSDGADLAKQRRKYAKHYFDNLRVGKLANAYGTDGPYPGPDPE